MRPEPDAAPARLRAAISGLVRRFGVSERADVSCCGVTVAQAAALEALCGHGPMRLKELGQRLGIAPSTLTRNLERLIEGGLVARQSDSRDARASRVRLTAAGRRAATGVAERERDFAQQVLDRIPADRRTAVLESLTELLTAVRSATEACCPGAFDHLMERFGLACGPGECDCGPARSADEATGA
ncbi:MAG TPA: MarR family winged helix-turn-helix transcriptional regulator [Vicinamibacteria bacterium]